MGRHVMSDLGRNAVPGNEAAGAVGMALAPSRDLGVPLDRNASSATRIHQRYGLESLLKYMNMF